MLMVDLGIRFNGLSIKELQMNNKINNFNIQIIINNQMDKPQEQPKPVTEETKLQKQQQPVQEDKKEQHKQEHKNKQEHQKQQKHQDGDDAPHDGKKQPQTLSEGERMGLSKQQLRKLQKKLAVQAKKKKKEQEAAHKQAKQAQGKQHKKDAKKGKQKQKLEATPQQLKQFNGQKIHIHPNKKSPVQGQQNILITSALPYVNNVPHLGNIIGCVLSADVYARFKRLQGSNVLYICGTDQYGTATEIKALQQKKTPKQICDHYHAIHKQVYQWFDIGFDYFGRTSTQWHAKICQEIFLNIDKNGRIIKEKMVQAYCEHCTMFLADRFVGGTCPFCEFPDARGDQCDKCQKLFNSPLEMKKPFCTICKNTPIQKETEHFFINLPEIQKQLQQWIAVSSIKGKWSQNSIAMTKGWINQGLKPKCITRDLKWGVPVPIEEYKQKVFYVWFDAPIGYISITANLLGEDYKNWWRNPEKVQLYQFMGKDNVPFHTVIFPSSEIAANKDWTLLHHISTTQYLNYESGKFSKRNGTGVFGDSAAQTGIPSEVWRYYLLVNRPEKSDSEFSWSDFVQKNNSQLLANIGNLCNRALKFSYSQYEKTIPKFTFDQLSEKDLEFLKLIEEKYKKYVELLNSVQIKQGLKAAMEISSLGNKYLQDTKFWQPEVKASGKTKIVIGVICNFLRLISLIFEPYIPSTSAKINYLLGLARTERDEVLGQIINEAGFLNIFPSLTEHSSGLPVPVPLFKQYTPEEAEAWRQKFKGQSAPQK